jgi:hypothetical protein
MKKNKASVPSFWISPQENIFETPIIKLISKLSHRRWSSGKISPYKDKSSLLRLQSVLKSSTRQQSPKTLKKSRKSPSKTCLKKKLPKPRVHPLKKKIKKKQCPVNKLKNLNGKLTFKAPKIYDNQIFRDVYDEEGNHDRIMETIDISQSLPDILNPNELNEYSLLIVSKRLDLKLKEYDKTEHKLNLKPPENSFLQETDDNVKMNVTDLFNKLQSLAKKQSQDSSFS